MTSETPIQGGGALFGDFDGAPAISCRPFEEQVRALGVRFGVVTAASAPRPSGSQRHRGVAAAIAGMLLLVACGGGAPGAGGSDVATSAALATPTPAATLSPGDIDPALLEPLTALGPCEVEPNILDEEPAEGALLPDGAVLTSQTEQGPLTQIKGYIPMTPVQIRVFYQRQDDYEYEILQVEDEIRESEVLLADGDNRLFVKAQAICELGSVFLAVLAPESSGDQVPVPAGGGGG